MGLWAFVGTNRDQFGGRPRAVLWNRRKRKAALATEKGGKLPSARSYLRVVPNPHVDDDEPMNENARKAVERAKEIASKKYLN